MNDGRRRGAAPVFNRHSAIAACLRASQGGIWHRDRHGACSGLDDSKAQWAATPSTTMEGTFMKPATFDPTNAICGGFFILVGLVFAWQSLQVDLGTWLRIGPGGMPLALSLLLVLLGAVILLSSLRELGEPIGVIAWRGILFITLAPILFGLTVRGLGFIGAVFITALFASFASLRMRAHYAVMLSVALTAFSTAVFSYALGLPFERIGPWLR